MKKLIYEAEVIKVSTRHILCFCTSFHLKYFLTSFSENTFALLLPSFQNSIFPKYIFGTFLLVICAKNTSNSTFSSIIFAPKLSLFYGSKTTKKPKSDRIDNSNVSFSHFFHISENARQFWLTATRQLGVPLWSTTLLMDFQGQKFTYIASINSWVVALELLMFFLLQKFIHGGWPKILTSCDSSLRKCTIKSHFNLDTPRTTCIKMHYIYLLILWILITLCFMSWKKYEFQKLSILIQNWL